MRLGEAIGLDRDDVDFEARASSRSVRPSSTASRLVPLHADATAALRALCDRARPALPQAPARSAFFVSSAGTPLDRSGVAKTLRQITTAIGIRTATVRPGT